MRIKRYFKPILTGVAVSLTVLGLASVSASSANISRAYPTERDIRGGSIVSLRTDGVIEPANTARDSELIGVAVADHESLIAINTEPGSVQVATTGSAFALASTVNGDIRAGDLIGVSPFNGIGAKAAPGAKVVGTAQSDFNGATKGVARERIRDNSGKATPVTIGYLRINIAPGTAPAEEKLTLLQAIVKTLTGRTVSPVRAVLALAIAAIGVLALLALAYAYTFSALSGVGLTFLRIFSMAVVVTATTITAVFLLVR